MSLPLTATKHPTAPSTPFNVVGGARWELSVFLLADTFTDLSRASAALAKRKGKAKPSLEVVAGVGALAAKPVQSKTPWWVSELGATFTGVQSMRQKSPGAVLFIAAAGRLFALTFGYGRSLLAPSAIVHDFGMRVVLNTASEDSIRSVDTRTIEQQPQQARRQVAKGRRLSSLGLDQLRDLLKGVTGRHQGDGALITGGDLVHRIVRANITDLRDVCAQLLTDYQQTRNKKTYGWVEDVRLVRDDKTRLLLEDALWAACKGAQLLDVGFALPELVDGDRLGDLRGHWDTKAAHEVGDDDVRDRLKKRANKATTAEKFIRLVKGDRIEVGISQTNEPATSWSLLRCLTWAHRVKGKTYILSAGDWYALQSSFVKRVEAEFDELVNRPSPLARPLVAATKTIPRRPKQGFEAAYNAHAAAAHGLVNLDTKSLTTGTGASAVEPCDLLDANGGVFIHVKDERRSSTTSHLFNQGTVSLETLVEEPGVPDTLRALASIQAGSPGPLGGEIDASQLTVMYAVIDKPPKPGRPWRLPFFGMLAARHADAIIRQRRAQMRIVRVDDQRLPWALVSRFGQPHPGRSRVAPADGGAAFHR